MADLLAANAAADPHGEALGAIVGGELGWLTWGKINSEVDRVASSLATAGLAPGDRVLLRGANSTAWCIADLAIARAGGVSVPVHASAPAPQVEAILLCVGARMQVEGGELRSMAPSDGGPASPPGLATIVFTSGTSGEPLGVMLSHANLLANAAALSEAVSSHAAAPPGGPEASQELRLCMLPLSHLYARTCDLYTWLVRRSRLVLAESRETILRDCALARPTAINSVPYFCQKLFAEASAGGEASVGASLKRLLGGAITHCYSGGAAMAGEIESAFESAGLPLMSGYGLTEAAPVVTASTLAAHRAGAVGRPLPGVEVRLDEGEEVLVRGPGVMMGYWRNDAATRAAFSDGWLCTGDLGAWTDDGFLIITGRKKELIVLSTGKKASPAALEAKLAASPWIEQAIVVGEGQPCLGALIVPNPDRLRAEVRRRRLWVWSKRGALNHPHVRALYAREIASRVGTEGVGVFTLIGRGFSIERGEMTPKLSLRRGAVALHFAPEIARMYAQRRTDAANR
ncbi:AMP-dependent synthetase/ligase [Pirellulimonas nuda]|nr:AMP-dependent synthetase/ligase [Pirellulimonas nuda]